MIRMTMAAVAMLGVTSAAAAPAADKAKPYTCTGVMIEPVSVAQSPKTVKLNLGPDQQVALDFGQGNTKASFVSNNKIQYKFRTKDFDGEFFHYTNELFLVYKSGHLARLSCTPA
jgi:hypothetical protein